MPQLGETYYTQSGHRTPARPPLVLIHGAGGTTLHWPTALRRLPGETVYAVDLPGHGKSGGVGRQSIGDYAGVVLEWLDRKLIERAILVGHSMGGAIAQALALTAPDRVAGLALVGTATRLRVNEQILEGARSEKTFAETVALIIKWSFSPSTPPATSRAIHQRMLQVRPPVLHGDYLACNEFEVTDAISAVLVPTLVIYGTADKMVPERYSRLLAEQIAGATLIPVPEAGHMVMLEQPQVVTAAVANYVCRYWGETTP